MRRRPGMAKATLLILAVLAMWITMSCASPKAPLMPDEGDDIPVG